MSRDIDYGDYACYSNDDSQDIADEMNITLSDCGDFSKSRTEYEIYEKLIDCLRLFFSICFDSLISMVWL